MSSRYERAVLEEREALMKEVRAMCKRIQAKEEEFKNSGLNVVYSCTRNEKGHSQDIFITRGDAGYTVRVNDRIAIMARSLDECAKQAYISGYIGYFTRVRIAHGKAAEERARKDPETLARLKKAGKAANAY